MSKRKTASEKRADECHAYLVASDYGLAAVERVEQRAWTKLFIAHSTVPTREDRKPFAKAAIEASLIANEIAAARARGRGRA